MQDKASCHAQVVALQVRSAARAGGPECSVDEETDYVATLNRALPDDIRVLGWAPAPEGFSARSARAPALNPVPNCLVPELYQAAANMPCYQRPSEDTALLAMGHLPCLQLLHSFE